MEKDFRPILTKEELKHMQSLCRQSYYVKEVFSSYSQLTLAVKAAGRRGNKKVYDKACKKLEDNREHIDWCIGHREA